MFFTPRALTAPTDTEFMIDDETITLIDFCGDESEVSEEVMLNYGIKTGANMDNETAIFIEESWMKIPFHIRDYFPFAFPLSHAFCGETIYLAMGRRWMRSSGLWQKDFRLLRREKSRSE